MDTIFKKIGRTDGTVKQRIAQLEKDIAYPETTEGRAKLMADIDIFIADALKRSALVFQLAMVRTESPTRVRPPTSRVEPPEPKSRMLSPVMMSLALKRSSITRRFRAITSRSR